jgi:DNA-binding NarL/FixJ family response regulator
MSHHLDHYRRAGVDAVVAKPVKFAELASAIQSLRASSIHADAPARMRA